MKMISSVRPKAALAVQPNILSAARFQWMIRLSTSVQTKASEVVYTTS